MNTKLQEVNSKIQSTIRDGCAFGSLTYEDCKLLRSLNSRRVLLEERNRAELETSLKDSYEALLLARKLLADADVSVKGGRIQAAIESAALTLYPPSAESVDSIVNGANLPVA